MAKDNNKGKERQNNELKKQTTQTVHQRTTERSRLNRRRKMRNLNIIILATVGLVVLLLASYLVWQYYDGQKPPTIGGEITSGSISTKVAPDFSLRDINGTQTSLSQLKGKVIGIHFMAVGCHGDINPINEYQLAQLHNTYDAISNTENIAFLTVAVATCENSQLDVLRSNYGVSWIMGNDYADKTLDIVNNYVQFKIGDGTVVLVDKNFNVAEVYNNEVYSSTLISKITQLSEA